jgi:general secretion pathway protein A
MYQSFYELEEGPFAPTPDPKYLYLTEAHQDGLGSMLYGVRGRKGFVLIVGEVGTGKTTLIRHVLAEFGADFRSAYLVYTPQTFEELLETTLRDLDVAVASHDRSSMLEALTTYLLAQDAEGRYVVLIVDEAQNLTPPLLEELRMLSNLETASGKLLQIILVGQPELAEKLRDPSLRQLRERIGLVAELKPLTLRQTADYVAHRLRVGGASRRDLFTRPAIWRIHRASRGIPRRVNVICDKALVFGFAEGAPRITARIVREVEREWRVFGASRAAHASWLTAGVAVIILLLAGGALLSPTFFPGFAGLRASLRSLAASETSRRTDRSLPAPTRQDVAPLRGTDERPPGSLPATRPAPALAAGSASVRPPATDDRPPVTVDHPLAIVDLPAATVADRPGATAERSPVDRPAATVERSPATVDRPPATEKRLPATEKRPPATEKQPPATEKQPPATEKQPPATEKRPPATEKQPPATEKQPPATEKRPVATEKQPPATEKRPPATEKRPVATDERPSAPRAASTISRKPALPSRPRTPAAADHEAPSAAPRSAPALPRADAPDGDDIIGWLLENRSGNVSRLPGLIER